MPAYSALPESMLAEHNRLRTELAQARAERRTAEALLERADAGVKAATDALVAFIDDVAGIADRPLRSYSVRVWDQRLDPEANGHFYEVRAGTEIEARRRAISAAAVKHGPSPYWKATIHSASD